MEKQLKVSLPKIKKIASKNNYSAYVVEPLWPGYGVTVGNSLRRVLLSSLPGVAANSVKFDSVSHEFSTIPKVKEDVVQIILNIKSLRFKLFEGDEAVCKLDAKGPKEVTATDIMTPSNCEIINLDQHIATLSPGGKLKFEIMVDRGMGYIPVEQKSGKSPDLGIIVLDSFYSPIVKVHYDIENTRVGQMTNFDKLILEITSDGTISCDDAIEQAGQILEDHFKLVSHAREEIAKGLKKEKAEIESAKTKDIRRIKIEESGLSTRTINALIVIGIKTIGGLAKTSVSKLKEAKGLGAKSFDEISTFLEKEKFKLKD